MQGRVPTHLGSRGRVRLREVRHPRTSSVPQLHSGRAKGVLGFDFRGLNLAFSRFLSPFDFGKWKKLGNVTVRFSKK